MGGHSKTAVIRRRRARKEKIAKLRKRYAGAASEEERHKIVEKLRKLSPFGRVEELLGSATGSAAKKSQS